MGLGTLIMGVSMIIAGIVQAIFGPEVGAWIIVLGIIVGFTLILYAQFKYNKGIF